MNKFRLKKIKNSLKNSVPGYSKILAERNGVSYQTIYRTLNGSQSRKANIILRDALALIEEHKQEMAEIEAIANQTINQ
jgi:hypothetical protein